MLEKLSQSHDLWLRMVVNMGCQKQDAEDIVQEMYINLDKSIKDPSKIMYGDEINRYFVYVCLRNLFISGKRLSSKRKIYPIIDSDAFVEIESNDAEMESAFFHYMIDKVQDEVTSWSKFDRELFYLHFVNGESQRSIARKSELSLNKVSNHCRYYKKRLRSLIYEDLQDYNNKDYRLKI
ncbi:MAG: hypothetical protein HRU18_11255 [Pseudoalteromonas sp.]|uniref:sigma-70 family RNA polymerase sigma factor n=1 Tax=Pseudoalteromonas sp. TaxID=53249 RepID=UPI001D97B510|nr:hypothetical protein [Pseudoalteromonas sp.]NRA78777.1 hypothetical protein [Pseudoalteromonas sp.]